MITTDFRKMFLYGDLAEISKLSKIPASTIGNWRYKNSKPTLANAEKVLNALGYELKIVKRRVI